MENEELIRENMERTRESLTAKLETLENKVVGSVQQATFAVTDTVSSVKETMHEGVEHVKDAFDVTAHVDRHPWLMFGGAVLAGMAVSNVLLPPPSRGVEYRPDPRGSPEPFRSVNAEAAQRPAENQHSWLGGLEPEFDKLKGLALGVTMGLVRDALKEAVPPPIAGYVSDIIDDVTKKVGGRPVSGPFTGGPQQS